MKEENITEEVVQMNMEIDKKMRKYVSIHNH